MTLKRKILTRIYALTFLLILAMSVTYYYLFTRDIRERSQQNVTMAYTQIFDDLHTRAATVHSKIEHFVQSSLLNPLYMIQMFQEQRDQAEPLSVWHVKKLMTYLHSIAVKMREFGALAGATEIQVYGRQKTLLAMYHQHGEHSETTLYLPEVHPDRVILIEPGDRWYAMLQDLSEMPLQPFPEEFPARYQGDIPDATSVDFQVSGKFLSIQFTTPVLNRDVVEGVCVIYLRIRQQDVERYARLSGTEVNVFAGSALSVGTLPEYNYIPKDTTKTRQTIDLTEASEFPPSEFFENRIRGVSYYQGTHKLKGTIRCESQEGQDTTFFLELPLSLSE